MCFLHYLWTEERNIVETNPEDAQNIKLTDILGVFRKNRAFLALCIHGICVCTNQYVSQTLGTYMYADVLGNIGMKRTFRRRGRRANIDFIRDT